MNVGEEKPGLVVYSAKSPVIVELCKDVKLYNQKPGCTGRIYSNFYRGGGVKCTKCSGWFCY